MNVRCKLGFHLWRYWHMAPEFIAAFPREINVNRTCNRCGRIEMVDWDGHWHRRL